MIPRSTGILLLLSATFILLCTEHSVLGQTPIGPCFDSRSTWFADNQHGACMYGTSLGQTGPGTFLIAASSELVFNNSADCGACYQITGPNGTIVTVIVVDQCTDPGVCNTSFPHLDLSPQAFDYLQNPTIAGVTDTQARRVACPVDGGIKLAVGTDFFTENEWEILIFNHRTLIRAVSITYSGQSTPIFLPRQTYNYWRYTGTGVTYPVTVSVTDIYNNVVSFQPLTFSSGLIVASTANPNQFPIPQIYPNSPSQCPAPLEYNPDGWIYTDELTKEYTDPALAYINTFGWNDYSYGCTINWAYTVDPYSGNECVQASIQGRGGIQIGRATAFSWEGVFSSLQFAIRGDIAFSGITVFFKGSTQSVAVPVTTSWQLFTLSLTTDLGTPPQIGEQVILVFQNTLGNTAPDIYLDSIRLVPVASSSTTGNTNTNSNTNNNNNNNNNNNPATLSTTGNSNTNTNTNSSNPATSSTTGNSNTNTNNNNPATSSSSSSSSSPATSTSSTGTQSGSSTTSCSASLSQVSTGGWTDGINQYSQWSVTLTNSPQNSKTLTFVDMSPPNSQASSITQYWSVIQSNNGNYQLPSWITDWGGLSPSQSLNWGYITRGTNSVNFQISNSECQ